MLRCCVETMIKIPFKSLFTPDKKGNRPPLEKWYGHFFTILIAYAVADVSTLYVRQYFLPNKPPMAQPAQPLKTIKRSSDFYQSIIARNIFDSDGLIPEPLTDEGGKPSDNIPVPSQLPLALLGTIVHSNPNRSVATIEIKGKNIIKPFVPEEDLEGLGTLKKVERKKAIFLANSTNRLEYIEIKLDQLIRFGKSTSTTPQDPNAVVKKMGTNQFQIKKSDINRLTNDLPSLLRQARALPYRNPNTGDIEGFRIIDMDDDSIFSQLGLQKMDIIMGVDGRPVTTATQAMQLYQTLKGNANSISLDVKRGSDVETFNYTITE